MNSGNGNARRKRVVAIVVAAVVLTAAAAWLLLRGSAQDRDTLMASGTVEAREADLGFQSAGRITDIVVREGTTVAAGALLARLDAAELEARVAQAEAQLAAAQARLQELERGARPQERAQSRAALDAARERTEEAARGLDRARQLHEAGAISQEALERAQTAFDVARSQQTQAEQQLQLVLDGARPEQVEAQRALVRQAEALLEQARASLDQASIRAPFAGVLTVRHRERGETVAPGLPVVSVMDPSDRWVRIYIREDAIGRVALGQRARIRADSYPDSLFAGRVTFIASEAEFTPRNVQTAEERVRLVYGVNVGIEGDRGLALKPGMPADVWLELNGR
ncbi:MAG: HlyD family secretion protein [Longimicrobiales bacterium]